MSDIRKWLLSSVLLATVLSCESPEKEAKTAEVPKEESPHALVETVTMSEQVFDEYLQLTGETEAVKVASVTPQVPGLILSLDITEGQFIEANVPVLTIDTSTARARIQSIDVQLEQLDRDIERTKLLIAKNLGTSTSLEQMESQRSLLKKSINEVRVGSRQAITKTPIAGIVTKKLAEPGEFASPGVPVARIIDISTMVVRAGLPERDILYVHEGKEVMVHVAALKKSFPGNIHRVGVEANTRNRTFPIEVHIDNANSELRAGMRAEVTLIKQSLPVALVIPRDAVLQAINGQEVFIVEAGIARSVPVELGPGMSRFVVVEKGLKPGAEIVVRGHRALVNGEPIHVVSTEPCCSAQIALLKPIATQGGENTAPAEGKSPETPAAAAPQGQPTASNQPLTPSRAGR